MVVGLRCFALIALIALASANLINTNVEREIDLSTQTVRQSISVSIANKGSSSVSSADVSFAPAIGKHLAFVEVTLDDEPLSHTVKVNDDGSSTVTVDVKISAGKEVDLAVEAAFSRVQVPLPREIRQQESQYMVYEDSLHYYSAYETVEEVTTVYFPSSKILSYSHKDDADKSGEQVTYGPFDDVAAFDTELMRLHFESSKSFFTVESLTREVDVSYLSGQVRVKENYNIRHTGASLKGGYSRYEDQMGRQNPNSPAVREFVSFLPRAAEEIYYRDEIGNISTSSLVHGKDDIEMHFEPRYPLFGGWNIDFEIGYILPFHSAIATNAAGSSVLNMTFGCPLEDAVADKIDVLVVLPEGSSNIQESLPFAVDDVHTCKRRAYLNEAGRPLVHITKANVVEEHDLYFQVTFDFSSSDQLREPLSVAATVGAAAIFWVLLSRFSFNVDPNSS